MPLNTVQMFLRDALDQLPLPLSIGNLPANLNTLQAFIVPPNPNDDPIAAAYIWGSHGTEKRLTVPRAQEGQLSTGGDKQIVHRVDVWLVWFGPSDDPDVNLQFPSVVDAVMARLRNVSLVDGSQHVYDPVTGQPSQLLAVAENLSWDYGPVRAVQDQRYLRYDAVCHPEVVEIIQA